MEDDELEDDELEDDDFDLPLYYLFGDLPVKIVGTEDGGMRVLSYNWTTGEFERAPVGYLTRALMDNHADDEEVTEEEFEEHVRELRAELGKEEYKTSIL